MNMQKSQINFPTKAGLIVLISITLGLLFDYFFYNKTLGIAFPLYIFLTVSGIFVVASFSKLKVKNQAKLLLIPLMFFGAMVFVRESELLTVLNIGASILLFLLLTEIAFGKKYNACKEDLETIKGNNLKELFQNINKHLYWYRLGSKIKEFNNIFNNELVIENVDLLCNCTESDLIKVPNYVISIENNAFENCKKLTSIEIPSSVTSIGDEAFAYCGLVLIEIPDSVKLIGNHAFQSCTKLTSIKIPNSVTSIGDYTFYNCNNLTSITIPNSVTSIGKYAFEKCTKLTSITIGNSVISIGDPVFYEGYYCY